MRFIVSDVQAETHAAKVSSYKEEMGYRTSSSIEAISRPGRGTIIKSYGMNQFVSAVEQSFASHYPLKLSPDSVWITIAQGFARHIRQHAEAVRKIFVSHEGQADIIVHWHDLLSGAPDNDWEGVIGEFSEQVGGRIGAANHRKLTAEFSTSGPVEKVASDIILLDAMQAYFRYSVVVYCGIPDIELTGSVEDWEKLRDKVNSWIFEGVADLSWWTTPLKQVLDSFVLAAKGIIDQQWWKSFYRYHEAGICGPFAGISGWINWLFPYICGGEGNWIRNPRVGVPGLSREDGLLTDYYPSSLSAVPFKMDFCGKISDMKFFGGIGAVSQDPETLSVTPLVGWGVGAHETIER